MNWDLIMEVGLKLCVVLVLVFLNGFFVAAEFALVKVRDTQLDGLVAKGQTRARITRRVIRNLDASLSACQLGITLASLALGWVGEPVFSALLGPVWPWVGLAGPEAAHARETIAVIVGFTAITFLHITAGEQAPKWLAIQKPLPVALFASGPLEWFHRLSYPFIYGVNHASLWMLGAVGLPAASESEAAHSAEELRLFLAASARETGASSLGRTIVLNAFDLHERIVREVMRPRREITVLDAQASMAECLELAEKSRFSRFPLCDGGDLDRTLGVVHIKDLFAMRARGGLGADLLSVSRKLIYVPETARLERLLQLFLERKLHFAIVVDEYGSTVGMVTLENILEELVGQIQDEFDQEKPLVRKAGEQAWELDGALPLHELSDLVGEPVREEGITTTNGLVTHRLGGFPKVGDTLPLGPYELRVEELDGLRVTRLRLARRPAA
ncbi:MAG: HlyC/CorC family transporter [Verrucomicrobia bacterium]|nr:HlyC/CorC family transporter [Verrucomicrobiota bacterium]